MSRAIAFSMLRGNQTNESIKVYLDYLVVKDMHFNNYVDHCGTQPFDEIVICFGWLACESRLTAPHLPDRIIWQFGYTQTIPKHSVVSAPHVLTHRQMDDMFDDYESHLVLEEAQSTIAPTDWSYVDEYIRCFFKVSHSYMVQAAPGDPPRSSH
ncbi:uncharacterized protein LOC127136550 [Lathyrus oleraceus]|uniref:uncharacterized protein LOC127136550 n=1 Tax=Pisum sativum TaxID=3888 RepID=UPI0021D37EB2|nr:uncharacterized protein LOC127136550 [Pisum sativum]